jgi:hypothetical protein
MNANENEILITLAGTLVVVLTTILQIWAMSRAKYKHNTQMLALENTLNSTAEIDKKAMAECSTHRCSLFCNTSYLLQIIFGVLIFVSFTCWAIYLVSIGFMDWAPLPGSLALIGLMTPIIAWRGFKHRQQAMSQLIEDISRCKKAGQEEDRKASEQAALARVETFEPVIDEIKPVAAPEPARQILPEPETEVVSEVVRPVPMQPKPAVVIEKQTIPQDSILKRHFLANLRVQIEVGYPSRPTDSILKRHFDSFIETEMENYIYAPCQKQVASSIDAAPIESTVAMPPNAAPVIESSTSSSTIERQHKLPQDSILRRHFLSTMQLEIESSLPPWPSDSILKRHYNSLMCSEMAKRLESLDV